MSSRPKGPTKAPAMDPANLEPSTRSSYPREYQTEVAGRRKRTLGDSLGITHYGVNLVELPPGAWSSQRHWHSAEDEFVYVVSGQVTLITDDGPQTLSAGMVAGFPAGKADGHHLVNEGEEPAVYLEIGDRNDEDAVVYPDIDMQLTSPNEGQEFQHRDGRPYRT